MDTRFSIEIIRERLRASMALIGRLAIASIFLLTACEGSATNTPSPTETNGNICIRQGGPPMTTFTSADIAVTQSPGRKLIALVFASKSDALLMIVDDAPSLTHDQIQVEIDIDPANGVDWNQAIEAWALCRRGSRVDLVEASIKGGINIGATCNTLDPTNDFRSGCTNTQTMLLDRSTTDEIWLRKPGFWGLWTDVAAFDSTIWQALGGRSVRFVWRVD